MVERQPSKLNVAGSNPVSRSLVGPEGSSYPGGFRADGVIQAVCSGRGHLGRVQPSMLPWGMPRVCAVQLAVRRGRIGSSGSRRQPSAHIAQAVERVLGKDEVTSSNLVVGSHG